MLDLPLAYQPAIDCDEIAAYDPTLPPKLYLRMFKSLNEPLVPHGLYEVVRQCRSVERYGHPSFLKRRSTESVVAQAKHARGRVCLPVAGDVSVSVRPKCPHEVCS
jgi:hypothetical protein